MRTRTRIKQIVCWGILVGGAGAIAYGIHSAGAPDVASSTVQAKPTPPAPRFDKSDSAQAARLKVINEGIRLGLLKGIDNHGLYVDAWITRRFLAMNFQEKQNVALTIYGYYFDGNDMASTVSLMDNITGKEVGKLASGTGLEMN